MLSGISSAASYGYSPQVRSGGQRPDPAAMQQRLFEKIDGDGDGSVTAAEFSSFSQNAPALPEGVTAPSFSDFDADSDGALSLSEFAEGSKALEAQLHSQFDSLRAAGGMPPPPPGGEGEQLGLSKSELSSLASALVDSNSTVSGKLTALAENFEAADSNQDGKVSIQELLVYQAEQDGATDAAASQGSKLQDRLQALVVALLGEGQGGQASLSVSA